MRAETLNLLCFSYAGGSATFYSRWANLLPAVRVIPVEIPGRGTEHQTASLVKSAGLLDFLTSQYGHFCTGPFVLFGHSLGARIAFEFLHTLELAHGRKAQRLFVSGCLAPDRFAQAMAFRERDLSDAGLLQVLTDLGGTPPELMANPELMQAALPIIRADFQLAIDLSKKPQACISAPINLLLGRQDRVTNLFEDYPSWARHTSSECEVSVIDGDHFFIRSQTKAVVRLVADKLQEIALDGD
ncbi:MAG: thioesterase [Moraxellaceae bacterium]|nr:MAG: thioesterase [Moraxellaceae bacterium]